MKTINSPRGTQDVHGKTFETYHWIAETARKTAYSFGCETLETPIFEFSKVFQKTLGKTLTL